MSLRVDINELPEDLRLALVAGDTVEFESDGELLARAERCSGAMRISWEEYFALRRTDPELDLDELERDLRRFREQMNRPMEPSPWE